MTKKTFPFNGLDAFAAANPAAALNLAGTTTYQRKGFGRVLLEKASNIIVSGDTDDALITLLESLRDLLHAPQKESFMVRLAQDARAHTELRLRAGKPRALLGTTPIINLTSIAQALRESGLEAQTLCFSTYYITEEFDFNLSKQNEWINNNRPDLWDEYRFLIFIWSYINFDLFFYYNDCGILRPGGYGHANYGINRDEMQNLVVAGKRLYTLTYGADNRTRKRTLKSGKFNFCMSCPEPGRYCICDDDGAAKVLDTIDQYATAMLASGLSLDYIPNCYELHYLVVDTEDVRAEPFDESEGSLRVLHAPNHGFFKGSDYLKSAVKTLQDEGAAIELEMISGKSNTEILEAMRRSHVVADQLIGGSYGQTTIEAMASGRPTLCYLKNPERAADPDNLPIINTNPDRLVDTLRDLCVKPRVELAQIGLQSRAYVEMNHSIKALSGRFSELLAATADLPDSVRLNHLGHDVNAVSGPSNLNSRASYVEARRAVRQNLELLLSGVFDRLGDAPQARIKKTSTASASLMDGMLDVYRGINRLDRQQNDIVGELRSHATSILNFIDASVSGASGEVDAKLSRLSDEFNGQAGKSLELLEALNSGKGREELIAALVDAIHAAGGATRGALVESLDKRFEANGKKGTEEFEGLISKVIDAIHAAGGATRGALLESLDEQLETASKKGAQEFAVLQSEMIDAVHAAGGATQKGLLESVAALLKAAASERKIESDRLRAVVIDSVHGAGADLVNRIDARLEATEQFAVSQNRKLKGVLNDSLVIASEQAETLRRDVVDSIYGALQSVAAQKITTLEVKLTALNEELATLRTEKIVLEHDCAQWETRAAHAEAERIEYSGLFERHTEALRQERDGATLRAESAQVRISALENSFSWRITGPVRRISRAAPVLVNGVQSLIRLLRAGARKTLSILVRPIRWVLDTVFARAWPVRQPHRSEKKRKPLYPIHAQSTTEWLAEFERINERKLKVLHIGNIANNAYNNAKIQRQRNIDADVLCNDYYHIMACPEWEDGKFKRSLDDDSFPDWWRAGLQNFKRPRWFAQGPLDASIRYLIAHSANAASSKFLWRWLTFERWMLCHPSLLARVIRRLTLNATNRVIQYDAGPANGILWSYMGAKMISWSAANSTKWPRLAPKVHATGKRMARFGLTADPMKAMIRHLNRTQKRREAARLRLDELLGGRENIPSVDWHFNWWYHPYMSLLFSKYDVIQAYATYTAMPFIIGCDYVAYEHGTIRSIPFQDTDEGKLCMATYRAADAVFVTNTDNLDSAEKMNLDTARVDALPHAFDSDKLVTFQRRTRISPPKNDLVFFTPARQHWVDGDPGWAKGNDRVIRALRILKDMGLACRLDAIEWGVDVPASQALAIELGVAEMINWLPKLKKRDLWRTYLRSHAILDQFVAPAFGGVTFEALMLGRRVITAVDEVEMTRFFGAPPPLYNCRTTEDIASSMARVIGDPMDTSGDGRRNQEWMQSRHSADTIVDIQVKRYRSHGEIAKAIASSVGPLKD